MCITHRYRIMFSSGWSVGWNRCRSSSSEASALVCGCVQMWRNPWGEAHS
uniref:Uncharacterized protein n=1 Tax=Anguilla anguilla TaxID=7936 RepID=A0A0E9XL41_ANGAN